MMSSFETSSPVSASTLAYLMRWPVLRLIWLKLIFSESEVAGYKATGQVTSERRKKPFQLARGAIEILQTLKNPDSRRSCLVGSDSQFRVFRRANASCQYVRLLFLSCPMANELKWYDCDADNPPWIKALAEVRHRATR